jgi:hypothetical protein
MPGRRLGACRRGGEKGVKTGNFPRGIKKIRGKAKLALIFQPGDTGRQFFQLSQRFRQPAGGGLPPPVDPTTAEICLKKGSSSKKLFLTRLFRPFWHDYCDSLL